jgi:ferredoxin
MSKVIVDREKCIGCGTCASLAPELFEMDDEGKSKVLKPEVSGSEADEAIESCPVEAISKEK